ncbi:MAG: hypothetical protein WCS92_01430 [Candidatus Babeliales bacterium]|jgi:hypothetical protein
MKKTYINKITMPVFLALALSGSVGHVWGAEKAPEKETPEKTAEKEAAEKEAARKIQEKIASTARKQVEAEEAQKKAQAELEKIKTPDEQTKKDIAAARTVEELQELLKKAPEEAQKKAIERAIELKKKILEQTQRTEDLKKRMAETTAKFKALETATQTPTKKPADIVEAAKAKVTSWKKRLLVGGGLGIGSIAGLGLIISELFEELSQASGAAAEFVNNIKEQWNPTEKDKNAGGEIIPNILPKADPNDMNYDKTLTDVAALFSNFDQDMKEMLEKNADYSSSVIKFEAGKVDIDGTQVAVSIKYDTEQLDVGLALIPVLITLAPQDLRGFALTPDDILGKMEDGAAKDMLTLVLNPTASFIFTIKLIQMYNAATKDSTKNTAAKIEYMLDEATELYSRFILSRDEDIAPDSLLSYLQQYPAIIDVLNGKTVKVYKDLADTIETPLEEQKTAFMDMQKAEIVEGTLTDVIKIFYNQFSQIYFKKFKNDGEYDASIEFTPSIRATKNTLQAIFYRGLKDVMKAGQELTEATGKVTLRKLDGTEYEVDPKADLSNLIAKPSSGIEAATNNLKGAITGLRKIIEAAKAAKKAVESRDMQSAKTAYTKAVDGIKAANSTASKAILEFRKKLAPFYPLTWDDGTSLTLAEFLIANIKALNEADAANVKALLNKTYSPFSKHLGLTTAQLSGSTQGKLVDRAVDTAKTLVTKFKSTNAAQDETTADVSSSDAAKTTAKPTLKAPAKPATKTVVKPSTSKATKTADAAT